MNILAYLLLLALFASRASLGAETVVKVEEPSSDEARWHLGVESVAAFGANGFQVLPGGGLAIGKTPKESGFIFDAGVYLMSGGFTLPPIYFHGGYQFSKNWRLWGFAGLTAIEDRELPDGLLLGGFEGEWRPMTDGWFRASMLVGIPLFYFILPLPPYVGTRLELDLSNAVTLQGMARVFPFTEFVVLTSLGLQIALRATSLKK